MAHRTLFSRLLKSRIPNWLISPIALRSFSSRTPTIPRPHQQDRRLGGVSQLWGQRLQRRDRFFSPEKTRPGVDRFVLDVSNSKRQKILSLLKSFALNRFPVHSSSHSNSCRGPLETAPKFTLCTALRIVIFRS